jgi:hypothetical protein
LAYALGLSRDVIPAFISYLMHGDMEILKDAILEMLGVDILQFAGLTFLFFSLVLKLKLKIWQMISCVFVFSTIGAILGETSTGVLGFDVLAGLLWGSWDRTCKNWSFSTLKRWSKNVTEIFHSAASGCCSWLFTPF